MLKIIILFVLSVIVTTGRAETVTTLTTGFDYSTGKYGTSSTTTILYIPVTMKAQLDYSYFKLTVPYISVRNGSSSSGKASPGKSPPGNNVIPGVGPVKNATTATSNAGLGDVVATAGYTVYEDGQLAMDAVGNIKFGTADASKYLGTGQNDYSAQLDSFYSINKLTWMATAGYKVPGSSADISLHNIFYGMFGASNKLSDVSSAGVMLFAEQSSNDALPGKLDITFFVSGKINKTTKFQLGLLKGFSDASPDVGLSAMISGTL